MEILGIWFLTMIAYGNEIQKNTEVINELEARIIVQEMNFDVMHSELAKTQEYVKMNEQELSTFATKSNQHDKELAAVNEVLKKNDKSIAMMDEGFIILAAKHSALYAEYKLEQMHNEKAWKNLQKQIDYMNEVDEAQEVK